MANETTPTSMGDAVAAEIVSQKILEAARAAVVCVPMCATDVVSGSNIKSYPRFVKVTATAAVVGTDEAMTQMSDSQVSCTLGEYAIVVALTDALEVSSSVLDIALRIAAELGKGYADKQDITALALASSLTDSVGNTGQLSNEDLLLQAIYESEANDIGGRPLCGMFYPKQVHQLRQSLSGSYENKSAIYSRPDILSGIAPAQPNGFCFNVFGVDIFQSTNVPTANGSADSLGMLCTVGADAPIMRAVGLLNGTPWDGRKEIQRDASLRATELWVTGYVGYGVIAPERGCGYLSVR